MRDAIIIHTWNLDGDFGDIKVRRLRWPPLVSAVTAGRIAFSGIPYDYGLGVITHENTPLKSVIALLAAVGVAIGFLSLCHPEVTE